MPWSVYEKTASGLALLFPYREYEGTQEFGDALVLSEDTPEQPVPGPPVILATSTMPSQTSATINWSAPTSGGPLFTYELFRSDDLLTPTPVQVGQVASNVLTLTVLGLPTNTPEVIHTFTVRGSNGAGNGAFSNAFTLQWNAVPPQAPTAPGSLTRTSTTATEVNLTWDEVADATVTRRILYRSGVVFRNPIASTGTPTLRQATVSGLSESTQYSFTHTRANSVGESPQSTPALVFTTPQGQTGTVEHDPVMGTSFPQDQTTKYTNDWPAGRIYDDGLAITRFNQYGFRVIALTSWGNEGGQTTANSLNTFLNNWYSVVARQQCEIHFAVGNEIDRDYSSALPAAYINTVAACYDVTQDYPMASMWVDMTQNNIRTGGSGPRFKPIARYLDGFGCSMYPPGRQADNPQPTWNPYTQYGDPVFAALADWRTSGGANGASLVGQLDSFACWEIGMPIDHSSDDGQPNVAGTTIWGRRPRYFAGGNDGVTNWEGYLNYCLRKCDAMGVKMREQLYWNSQDNPDIPNPFQYDRFPGHPVPGGIDTEEAWHEWDWTANNNTGSRLPELDRLMSPIVARAPREAVDQRVTTYLTTEEKQVLTTYAKTNKITMSDAARRMIKRGLKE